MNLTLRREKASDFHGIYLVHQAAFRQEAEGRLVEKLRKNKAYIPELSLVAIQDNLVVGHIIFSKIKISGGQKDYESLTLAPLGVLTEFQNKGIGSLLVREGLKKARELGYRSVIVLGHKNFYPRFGFVPASRWGIESPYEVPDEAFMAIELVPGGLDGISGKVKYDEAFEEL
ncbi:MAG TPA: N-acetyltransferase [Saprospiraceae bacterium]|nr:N-acetyltransferase [Saprospiraceae bacterium]HNT20413.1 N-acetyltransferase [Saprospiraceae bacterium]